jgi:hypothetical protein
MILKLFPPPVSRVVAPRCRMDDPLIWGTLPLSAIFSPPEYVRHALGSADICFTNPYIHIPPRPKGPPGFFSTI